MKTVFSLLLLISSTGVGAFVPQRVRLSRLPLSNDSPSFHVNGNQPSGHTGVMPPTHQERPSSTSSRLLLANNSNNDDNDTSNLDGSKRGLVVMAIVLLATVWSFSIPPEFRRAYICSDRCSIAENRARPQCNNCVTGDEWMEGVKEYYRNGGGIQFDFSIDPNSKMKF